MMQLSQSLFRPKSWFATNERLETQFVQLASSFVILVGCLVLMGWTLNLGVFKSGMSGLTTMKANTAICFVLAGISLKLQARRFARKTQHSSLAQIANGCAIAIVIIASLTLYQYLFGWNFGIDELLFRDLSTSNTLHPGRMGFNTAINFCLTGMALWLVNGSEHCSSNRPPHQVEISGITILQILAVAAAAIAIQAIVCNTYKVQPFYPVNGMTTSMAIHTALNFLVLSGGLLGLKRDQGFMRVLASDLLGSNTARRLSADAILLPPIVGWWILQGQQQNLYDSNFALLLMTMTTVGMSLGLIWQNAGIINRLDYAQIQSKERIQASEERLQLALKGAKEGIWDWDLQTQALTWNDRCKELFGFPPDTLITLKKCLSRIHPDDRQQVIETTEAAVRGCGELDLEYRTTGADDTIRWILAKGSCYGDSTGEPYRMLGTMLDITPRKQAQLNEQFLHELTRWLRHFSDPDEIQWEATKSLGKYLNVDGATWCEIDWKNRLATVHRSWRRDELGRRSGVYEIADFLSPGLQAAMVAGESVAIADVAADPSTAPYVDNYQRMSIGAFVSIPCINEDNWVATIHVNTKTVRVWRDDEVALIESVVARLWSFIEEARAVQALREQEEQTRRAQVVVQRQLGEIEAIYRNAPIGLGFVDTDLRYVRINERLAQINGSSVSEHIGKTFHELLPELADRMEPLYRQVIALGEPIIDLEISGTNRAQPGIERQWLASFYPQTDAEDRVVGVNTVVQEITDRKQMEMERLEAERSRDCFFDLSLDLLATVSFNGYFTQLNPSWELTLGFTNAELMARPFIDLVHPDDQARTIAGAQKVRAGETVTSFENRYICQDGSYRWLLWNVRPYLEQNLMYASAHDITERKQTEAALRESERKFSAIFEQSFKLMGIVSLDGVLLEVNQTALDSIGAHREDIAGKLFWETPWWHTPQLQEQLKEAINRTSKGEFSRYEVQFPNSSGVTLTTDFSLKPVFDEFGRVVRIVAEAHDITDRNRIQSELEDRNQELDSFVHIVSHDLKAPLRAISNLSQWIEDDLEGSLPATSQEHMELLRTRVQRMEAMIDGLLNYARIGRMDGLIEQVIVSELLTETIHTLAPPPTIKILMAQNLPTLQTSRILLAQVFANLIGNAIKHHDREDGVIQVGIAERDDVYEFAIADDGPGIDPIYHERVFRIFQAMNPQNRPDSSGVGLAIVKKIVEAEGGTIRLESQLGQGTTFYFTWPKRA
jgi:PAS domain S-box-containing protein